jgi:hypothetical protein
MCLSGVTCLPVDCYFSDRLRVSIMCLSGVTCLPVDCYFSDRLKSQYNVSELGDMSSCGLLL